MVSDVQQIDNGFSQEELRLISTWDDALAAFKENGKDIADASLEIGDGFTMETKNRLTDIKLLFIGWQFTAGDYGSDYVIIRALTEHGKKVIITDGGLGLCQQMREYTDRTGRTTGLLVNGGLRASEYTLENGDPATTYYLNV